MRRRHLLWIVSSLAIGLNACTTFRPQQQPLRLDTAKACADWRWIGISRPGARCPDAPGWTVRPLFAQLAPAQQQSWCDEEYREVPGPQVIRELNRFCVYEIADPHKKLREVPFPAAASDLVRLDQDCAALSVSAATIPTAADWRSDFERLLEQAAGTPRLLEINDRLGVRLAFLDTQPTGEGAPAESGRSLHGYTLTHIARHLVCTPGPYAHCAAQITTRLALPIIDFDPKKPKGNLTDPDRGGFIGLQSDLAEAIRNEVDSWLAAKAQQHLVLNLSLAWDGDLFGGLDEEQIGELRAGTQAVYWALRYAAGYDVLVLAAAGNQKGEPCQNTGPLLPAAWEWEEPQSCLESRKKRLLYAVGGVQSDGEPLANARHGGMPPRAAYAENAVVPSWDPDRPTATLTGSSVGTAVASSIAAVVWDRYPNLDSHEVMDILYESGNDLGRKADFWFGASAPPTAPFPNVHRLSLCAALEEACDRYGPEPCPPCDPWKPASPSTRIVRTLWQSSCQPWLVPQPEDMPCLGCKQTSPATASSPGSGEP